ncbi:MAG TPA: heterodisulfide reductase subunit B [Spirochaetales bacterium]|nr:heterodisulfide reductase subunit B [Spirochaetales bacterium]
MKYAYFPGCSLHSTALDYDESARAVAKALDVELVEVPDWTCCGASPAHVTNTFLSLSLPLKNLQSAEKISRQMVVFCAACYSRFKFAEKSLAENQIKEKIKKIINLEDIPEVKTRHFLDILINEIGLENVQNRKKQDLKGIKVACYYGCLLIRPPKVAEFDDPEQPSCLDNLVEILGAVPVSWPYKNECCGASLSLSRTDIVLKLTNDILQDASEAGAECLVVACPLCQANLELRQKDINKKYRKDFSLPVFYFTQLLGLALGIDKKSLGLHRAMVSGDFLLKEKGIA